MKIIVDVKLDEIWGYDEENVRSLIRWEVDNALKLSVRRDLKKDNKLIKFLEGEKERYLTLELIENVAKEAIHNEVKKRIKARLDDLFAETDSALKKKVGKAVAKVVKEIMKDG